MTSKKAAAETMVTVADEVWIATALLHREHPDQPDFAIRQIVDRAQAERVHPTLRPGVYVHVVQHCVANRAANPGRYRMLYETGSGRRRLFKPGDDWHPDRKGGRTQPAAERLPDRYRQLLEWFQAAFSRSVADGGEDPILALRGLGREIWRGVDPDSYVADLRRGWE
jgi:hypothetical protein